VMRFEDHSHMIEDIGFQLRQRSPEKGPSANVIIVGAGVAGAALAHTLGKESESATSHYSLTF
ncbi:squalene monooxygenase-like protein, partial [Corchorus capsularis]